MTILFRSLLFLVVVVVATDAQPTHDEPSPVGRLVDIGGYKLHIYATGKGSPPVILLPGAGDFSFDWSLIQSPLTNEAQVVSYDRAGFAWSDLGPTPRTMRQEAFELHTLLEKSSIRPPYILVGHSLGGLVARIYAKAYPKEVAGIIFVDATHEDTVLFMNGKTVRMREIASPNQVPPVQTMQTSPPRPLAGDTKSNENEPATLDSQFLKLPLKIQKIRLWFLEHPKRAEPSNTYFAEELRDLFEARKAVPHELGAIPVISIAPTSTGRDSDPKMDAIMEEKRKQKRDLATLSTDGRFIEVPNTGHHIQLDAPAAVVSAIKEMLRKTPPR